MTKNTSRLITGLVLLILAATSLTMLEKPVEKGQGEAAIGGDFSLTDQSGKTVRDADFRGKTMLVFFGFTHCPDICPVTAATLGGLLKSLGDRAEKLAVLFITVDPARDTPETLKAYLENFDPRIIGLTGSDEQIRQAASAYKAYYEAPAAAGHGDHGDHGGGMVNHSGFIYLMDRDGKYVRHFPYDASEQDIAAALQPLLK